ncbi:hypothetical protein ARMGADRAFT_1079066 [Armillaria gallica]|uniref:Uncharacterized protein n=1 Tax=Armillaria gallica TaxID=47427 RepID=A0A2H3DGP3_ARMGA|nr:hypothetical protein ARMGADRAFT_1079066 [Armillaria gallica]
MSLFCTVFPNFTVEVHQDHVRLDVLLRLQSNVTNSELSTHSLCHCGHVLFVDDEASEESEKSATGSDADEEADIEDIMESDSSSVSDTAISGTQSQSAVVHDSESEYVGDTVELAVVQGCSSCIAVSPCSLHLLMWCRRIKTKTPKGAYVNSMLSSGKEANIADDDNTTKDPTIPVHISYSKKSDMQVYLEDLETLRPPTHTKSKSPVKPSTTASSCKLKAVKAVENNCCLQVETVALSPSPSKLRNKITTSVASDNVVNIPPLSAGSTCHSLKKEAIVIDSSESDGEGDDCSVDTASAKPLKSAGLKSDKVSGSGKLRAPKKPPVKPAIKSKSSRDLLPERMSKMKGKGKGKGKVTKPLFYSSDEDAPSSPSTSILPSSQVANQLTALLRDNLLCSQSPEVDADAPVSYLPDTILGGGRGVSRSTSDVDLSEPADLTLRIMQPHLMEEHLVTLRAYLELPPLGYYQIVVPVGYPPNNFDAPPFHSFDIISKLFHIVCLMSLLEYFKWTSYGNYVNLRHMAYSILSLEGRTVCMGDSPAVCMTFNNSLKDHIIHEIDTYNDELDDMRLLDRIDDGDHLYYHYMEQLTHVGYPSNSTLYHSLFEGYHYLISDAPTYVDPLLWYYIPDIDRCPSLHDPNYLPAEM